MDEEEALCEAALKGNVAKLQEIISKDELILYKLMAGSFSGKISPLHLAASRGHTEFVQELIDGRPEMCLAVDGEGRNALHVAASSGHTKLVRVLTDMRPEMCLAVDGEGRNALHVAASCGHTKLVRVLAYGRPEMCLAADGEGRNALHVAAVNGRDEVLKKLMDRASPHAARDTVSGGDNLLHLCVKYNRLSTLKVVLERIVDEEFVNAKDSGGRTILHLAVSGQQVEIVRHILSSKININEKNANEHTAMDLLLLAKNESDLENDDIENMEAFIRAAKAKRAKDLVQGEWLTKKRETLMIVASLIATMAFQAGVNPPGGVWQDDSDGHRAGEAVMAYNFPDMYSFFLRSNTIGFVASLSTIMLLISGLPFKKREFMWSLAAIMGVTIASMAFTYTLSIVVVTPKEERQTLSRTIVVAVTLCFSVMALLPLGHIARSILNALKERQSRNKAMKTILIYLKSMERIWTRKLLRARPVSNVHRRPSI